MPTQEFWNEDPDLLWVYRNFYFKKVEQDIKLQKEMINFQSWLQGLYNYYAIGNAFNKNGKYFDKPIELNEKPKTIQEQNQIIAEKAKTSAMRIQMLLKQRREDKG